MRWVFLAFMAAARAANASGAPTIDAHDVDFAFVLNGSTAVRYVNIGNVDTPPRAPLVVTSAQLTGNIDSWFSFATPDCPGSISSCTFSPSLTIVDAGAVVAIRCSPPSGALGSHVAIVTFASNSVSGGDASALLSCTSAGGIATVTPASNVLDFGAVDLDRVPASVVSSIRIRNDGTADITTGVGIPTGSSTFQFASLSGHVLPPGGSFDIAVTYTPVAEAPDTGLVTIPVTGAVNTSAIAVTVRGRGADRHASIAPAPSADTFVNPGGSAPLVPITIHNSGEAILGLSNATVTGGAAWSVANPDPVDLPGHASFDYLVRFTPMASGPAPTATFSVATTDDLVPMLTTTIEGTGRDRHVMMSPDTVEMYFAAVDTTAHLSDGTRGQPLRVQNFDPDFDFTIRGLPIVGGEGAFRVEDTTGVIGAGATRTFDVLFTPRHAGVYEATAYLFLDNDPVPQASVVVRGEGVFVGVEGGGGCAASNGADVGTIVVVIALLAMRRRRRWLALLACGGVAHADSRNLDLAQFDPTPATTSSAFQLRSADVGRNGDWVATALATYASSPLVLRTAPNDNVAIDDRMTLALGGAVALGERFELALHMPIYLQSGENLNSPTMFGEPAASGTARGDLTFDAKARLFRRTGPNGAFVGGLAVALGFPTASDEVFAGSGKPQVRVLALASVSPGSSDLDLTLNAGPVFRATTDFHDVHQGSALAWGLGASYRATGMLSIAAELFGELVPSGRTDAMGNTHVLDTIEALAGVHVQLERRISLGVAIGRGVTSGIGAPAVRGVLMLTFAPKPAPSIGTRYVAGDTDHDGIANDIDQRPDQAEDKDGFEDDDGCPDPDNDHDGIADAADKCPLVAEDRDGFQDDDGCPELDNDFDGIPDRFDHCPNQAETINGIDDEDGCPDAGESLVALATDRVVLKEQLQFAPNGKLAPASFNVLGQLGATLRAHPELVKLRILAHTPSTHARAVVDWLLQYGISADRLEAVVAPDATDATEERIEIVIVDRY